MPPTRSLHAKAPRRSRVLRSPSAATRARIVAVAEQLFAARGIDAVSLREINTAAGQNNKSALQYHFRNKLGLIEAILEKHQPGIERRGHQMLDEIEGSGDLTLPALAEALVRPIAEKLDDPDGGVAFIQVHAQLIGHPQYSFIDLIAQRVNRGTNRYVRLYRRTFAEIIPEPLHVVRGLVTTGLVFHALADYSHLLERQHDDMPLPSRDVFISNLIDNLVGLYQAPVSEDTRRLLGKEQRYRLSLKAVRVRARASHPASHR